MGETIITRLFITTPYFHLMRWHSPTGAILLYAPCAWGLALAGSKPHWYILFAIGAWFMRSFGCILNDLADRKLDALVPRTQNRPLASRTLTPRNAIKCALFCLLPGACVWLTLPLSAQKWSLVGLFLACLYPFSKRFFIAPQLILGITFNIGALIAYISVTNICNPQALYLWASSIFWTVAYDTVYAFHDAPYDRAYGFHSTAHMAQSYPRLFVGVVLFLHLVFLIPILTVKPLLIYALGLIGALWHWKPNDSSSSIYFFHFNTGLAFVLWLLILHYRT